MVWVRNDVSNLKKFLINFVINNSISFVLLMWLVWSKEEEEEEENDEREKFQIISYIYLIHEVDM